MKVIGWIVVFVVLVSSHAGVFYGTKTHYYQAGVVAVAEMADNIITQEENKLRAEGAQWAIAKFSEMCSKGTEFSFEENPAPEDFFACLPARLLKRQGLDL